MDPNSKKICVATIFETEDWPEAVEDVVEPAYPGRSNAVAVGDAKPYWDRGGENV